MEETKNEIFRESSIERISSPDELNDYIRVVKPGVWATLAAIVIFLAGAIYWCCTAELETRVDGMITSDMGVTLCYISEDDVSKVQPGMKVKTDEGEEYLVTEVEDMALDASQVLTEYQQHVGDFMDGQWIVALQLDKDAPEGVRSATVIIDSVSPLSFLIND